MKYYPTLFTEGKVINYQKHTDEHTNKQRQDIGEKNDDDYGFQWKDILKIKDTVGVHENKSLHMNYGQLLFHILTA